MFDLKKNIIFSYFILLIFLATPCYAYFLGPDLEAPNSFNNSRNISSQGHIARIAKRRAKRKAERRLKKDPIITLREAKSEENNKIENILLTNTNIDQAIKNTHSYLWSHQKENTYWSSPLVMNSSMDAVALVLAKNLGKLTPELLKSTLNTIEKHMTSKKGWASYPGGPVDDNVSGIVITCLKAIGIKETDDRFIDAFDRFEKNGGINGLSLYSSFMLSPLGILPDKIILPSTPLMTAKPEFLNKLGSMIDGFIIPLGAYAYLKDAPDNALLADFKTIEQWKSLPIEATATKLKVKQKVIFDEDLRRNLLRLGSVVTRLTTKGSKSYWAQQAISYTLNRQTKSGAWYGLYLSVVALQLLNEAQRVGLGDFSEQIEKGWKSVLALREISVDGLPVFGGFNEAIWETSCIYNTYLSSKSGKKLISPSQQHDIAKWLLGRGIKYPNNAIAWSFPIDDKTGADVDTTASVVQSLSLSPISEKDNVSKAIDGGIEWILSLQNKDGGFPAWTKGQSKLISYMSNLFFQDLAIKDTSQSDITGRVMHTFKVIADKLSPKLQKKIITSNQNSCKYLANLPKAKALPVKLEPGVWMANYTYSASSVLIGLASANCNLEQQERLVDWLISLQDPVTKGWGESLDSYKAKTYIKGEDNMTQSSLIIMGLITYVKSKLDYNLPYNQKALTSINEGINFLIHKSNIGKMPYEKEFYFRLFNNVYGRYDLAPTYTTLYSLQHWQKIQERIKEKL